MSKKYLMNNASTGFSKVKVKSKFGEKILSKLGWKEGDGLGKKRDGMLECIQLKKREDLLGVGAVVSTENWKNQWWEDMYNDVVTKVDVQPNVIDDNLDDEGSTSSSDEEIIVVSTKKQKQINESLLNKKRKK